MTSHAISLSSACAVEADLAPLKVLEVLMLHEGGGKHGVLVRSESPSFDSGVC